MWSIFKDNDELDSTLLIIGALGMWALHGAAMAFNSEFAQSAFGADMGSFIEDIVMMVFVYKFTKSIPSKKGGGNNNGNIKGDS